MPYSRIVHRSHRSRCRKPADHASADSVDFGGRLSMKAFHTFLYVIPLRSAKMYRHYLTVAEMYNLACSCLWQESVKCRFSEKLYGPRRGIVISYSDKQRHWRVNTRHSRLTIMTTGVCVQNRQWARCPVPSTHHLGRTDSRRTRAQHLYKCRLISTSTSITEIRSFRGRCLHGILCVARSWSAIPWTVSSSSPDALSVFIREFADYYAPLNRGRVKRCTRPSIFRLSVRHASSNFSKRGSHENL